MGDEKLDNRITKRKGNHDPEIFGSQMRRRSQAFRLAQWMRHWGLLTLPSVLLWLAAATLPEVEATHWAVIVVGSRGFGNYRHQADGCHAYHVLREHGIPQENIILMMYDDVADDPENPFPGKLFNRPTIVTNGTASTAVDVYANCQVEYREKEVTPEMFLHVLMGNKTATKGKRVLQSTADDRVFITFIDHGAPGIVAFPRGKELHAKVLKRTLEQMHQQGKYKELVFYMEACHSGSMFSRFMPQNLNVFVTTAANADESSWAIYCPPHDVINGIHLDTCLGDEYSVNWMEDSDAADVTKESLQEQYTRTKNKTAKSHVQEFGSKKVRKEIVGNFQSTLDNDPSSSSSESGSTDELSSQFEPEMPLTQLDLIKQWSTVESYDVDLVTSFYKYLRVDKQNSGRRQRLAQQLVQTIQAREAIHQAFENILTVYKQLFFVELPHNERELVRSTDCYHSALQLFQQKCVPAERDDSVDSTFWQYGLQYAGILADLCQAQLDLAQITTILETSCAQSQPVPATAPIALQELVSVI